MVTELSRRGGIVPDGYGMKSALGRLSCRQALSVQYVPNPPTVREVAIPALICLVCCTLGRIRTFDRGLRRALL